MYICIYKIVISEEYSPCPDNDAANATLWCPKCAKCKKP